MKTCIFCFQFSQIKFCCSGCFEIGNSYSVSKVLLVFGCFWYSSGRQSGLIPAVHQTILSTKSETHPAKNRLMPPPSRLKPLPTYIPMTAAQLGFI